MSTQNQVQILIGDYDYTPYVLFDSVTVDNNIVMTSDTLDMIVQANPDVDQLYNTVTGQYEPFIRPMCGREIVWQNPSALVNTWMGSVPFREFGGVCTEVKETQAGVDLVYQVHGNAYDVWFDRHLVVGYYNEDNPENIIKTLVQKFAPTFDTSTNIQSTSTTVVPQYFDYMKMSDAIKTVSDQLEYGFYVDYYRSVHFYAAETFTSPLPNNTLDVDNDVANYGDLEIDENSDQQYNRIFVRGFKVRSADFVILTFSGDSQTTQWSTGYRLSSVAGDTAVQVYSSMADYQADTSFQDGGVATRGVPMTLAKDIVDGSPDQKSANNTAYIHFTQHLLRISEFNNNGAVPSGYVVAIRFHYMKDMVFLGQDPSAQSETAQLEGTDGIYEYAHFDKSLTNSTMTAVEAKASLLLMKYRFPQKSGNFNTYFDGTSKTGWLAGQYFLMKSNRRFGGIDEVMFVLRVDKSIVQNANGKYVTLCNVQFADSPYLT